VVNGQPVKKHFLQSNDVIELGKYKLKYVNEAPMGLAKAADFEKTMVLRPGAVKPVAPPAPAPSAAHETAPAKNFGDAVVSQGGNAVTGAIPKLSTTGSIARPATIDPMPKPAATGQLSAAVLQLLSGANAGKELELTKPLTSLGKPGVQVAVITRRPQGYFITHVEGANFPVVNGKPLDAQAHSLNDHDVIELAGVKMEFFLKS
jgi:hypothetical protein